MKKERISDRQGIALMILFIAGTSTAYPTASEAGRDIWLAILVAIAAAALAMLLYIRILSLYPGRNIFDIVALVFGKWTGKILMLLLAWFAFHIGVLIIEGYGNFMITVSLPETPRIVPMILITLLAIWGVKEGIEVLGRWAALFIVFNLPLPIFTTLSLIPEMRLSNIRPILYNGWHPVMTGAFHSFSFPFAETMVFMMLASSFQRKSTSYKVYYIGLAIGGILTIVVNLTEMLVLGPELHSAFLFPSHSVASKIHIGELIQRLELVVIVSTYTAAFIKLSLCLMGAAIGVAKLLNLDDYRHIACPIGFLMLNVAAFIHKDLLEASAWSAEIWPYYALFFQVILPCIILIVVEIKTRVKKKEVS